MLVENNDRKVVPRWRDFSTTAAIGELSDPTTQPDFPLKDNGVVAQRYDEWSASKTIWHAADLLSSALVAGNISQFKDVAEFVLENEATTPSGLVRLAQDIVAPPKGARPSPTQQSVEQTRQHIHLLRRCLVNEPRNAIRWTDLSRLYASIGQGTQAAHAMSIASSLSPTNRFILRSAARLFLHLGDAGFALRLIRKSPDVAIRDPWILAAEVAVSSADRVPSLFAKRARLVAENASFSDFARTELQSALATLEMESGKIRPARQMFRRSLTHPNENSLAQVEWAERSIGGIGIDTVNRDVPLSFEADATSLFSQGQWDLSYRNAVRWMDDQPFSSRPVLLVTYLTSTILEDHAVSIEILNKALEVNPGSPILINNLAFAQASSGNTEDAIATLNRVDFSSVSGPFAVALIATLGLVHMRQKQFEEGRQLYRQAIDRASDVGIPRYRVAAAIHWALEEAIGGTDEAPSALKFAEKEAADHHDPDIILLLTRVRGLQRESSVSHPA